MAAESSLLAALARKNDLVQIHNEMFVAMDLFIFCQVEDYTHKIVLSGSMYLNNFLIFHQDNIEKKN